LKEGTKEGMKGKKQKECTREKNKDLLMYNPCGRCPCFLFMSHCGIPYLHALFVDLGYILEE